MNKCILVGRLTRDPEIRVSQSNEPITIAKFTLAVDRRVKKEGEQSADFINCVAFGKLADFIDKYCKQGTKLLVSGEWRTGSYTNKSGQKVYTNECLLSEAEFAELKKDSEPQQKADSNEWMNVPDAIDEELPFN